MANKTLTKLLSKIDQKEEFLKQFKKLLQEGKLRGTEESIDDATLLEEAIYYGYSEEDMLKLLRICIKAHVDLNYQSAMYGDTFMHALIEADDYIGKISYLLYMSYEHGFNPLLKNKVGKTVWDCLEHPDTTKRFDSKDVTLCWEIKKLYDRKKLYNQLKELQRQFKQLENTENVLLENYKNQKHLFRLVKYFSTHRKIEEYKKKKEQLLFNEINLEDELKLYQDVTEEKIKEKFNMNVW